MSRLGTEPTARGSEQATSGRWILRIGSRAGIVGALLAMVGNLLHPATPTGDPEGVARTIADSRIWVVDHLVIVVGLILMLGGLVAIFHSIQGGLPGALARFGYVAAVAGVTVGLILVILDGVAAKQIAEAWAAAPPDERAVALRLVLAEETINFALAALFNILFAGFTFVLYGLAVALSRAYPRWLGWVVAVAGFGSMVVGAVQASAGESTPVTRLMTIVFPTIITLWTAMMGILVVRRAAVPQVTEQGEGKEPVQTR
jgi:hypothetical protein